MARLSKLLFAAAAIVAVPVQSALAQGGEGGEELPPPEGEGMGDTTGEAMPDPNADPNATPPPTDGAVGGYPQQVILRPPTLPAGMLEVTPALTIARLSTTVLGVTASATAVGLGASAGYGVTEKIEAGGGYAIQLYDGFDAEGPLTIYGLYSLVNDDKMRANAGASFTYNIGSSNGDIGLGAFFQYAINDKLVVFTPGNQLQLGLIREDIAGMSAPTPITLHLPVAAGYQATEQIFAFLQLDPINISISDSSNTFFDPLGVQVGGLYSMSEKLDVFGSLNFPSIADAGDLLAFVVGANLRM